MRMSVCYTEDTTASQIEKQFNRRALVRYNKMTDLGEN